jgi:hypothetical protein
MDLAFDDDMPEVRLETTGLLSSATSVLTPSRRDNNGVYNTSVLNKLYQADEPSTTGSRFNDLEKDQFKVASDIQNPFDDSHVLCLTDEMSNCQQRNGYEDQSTENRRSWGMASIRTSTRPGSRPVGSVSMHADFFSDVTTFSDYEPTSLSHPNDGSFELPSRRGSAQQVTRAIRNLDANTLVDTN